MVLQYLLVLAVIISSFQTNGDQVTSGAGPLDCVRIRGATLKRLVFGTGYFREKDRYMGVYNQYMVPHNSAFRIERIAGFKEPLYNIRMINTREYLYGGDPSTATHYNRVPVFGYSSKENTTHPDAGVWLFEKAYQGDKWLGGWFIKNLYYQNYMIASNLNSEAPKQVKGAASFKSLKLDRKYQPRDKDDQMFFFEEC